MLRLMGDMLKLILWVVIGLFRSRTSLEAEIVALRHQLNVLRRKSPKRLAFSNFDRLIFAGLYRIAPNVLNALVIVKPETVIGWHRAGFRLFWRWKSRRRGGRPKVALEIRQLAHEMSLANPSVLRASIENCPNSDSTLVKPRSPNIWRCAKGLRLNGGRPFSGTMPMALRRWTCLSSRQSRFDYFTDC